VSQKYLIISSLPYYRQATKLAGMRCRVRENKTKKEIVMWKLALALAAAATVGLTAPASAQGIYFGAGPGGVAVGVGPTYDDRPWWDGHYSYYDNRGWWGDSNYGDCRVVRTERRRPDGTIAVRTRRVCD
jgi:hypothetical protein